MKQSTKYLKILVNLMVAVFTIVFLCFIFPKIIVFFMPFVIGWIIAMIANHLVSFIHWSWLSGCFQTCGGGRNYDF